MIAFCCCCLKWGIEIGSYVASASFEFTVAEAGLQLLSLLSLPPKCWDYMCVSPSLGVRVFSI